jgi:hypothetical protein
MGFLCLIGAKLKLTFQREKGTQSERRQLFVFVYAVYRTHFPQVVLIVCHSK